MSTFTTTIGWTLNRSGDPSYSSFSDGYRAGAPQRTLTIDVEWTNPTFIPDDIVESLSASELVPLELERDRRNAEAIAEAAFVATNHPFPHSLEGIARQIADAIDATDFDGSSGDDDLIGHYSLSVGDTVTVNGLTLACDRLGWKKVTS